jgi:biopolymer transport protein ExbD/biopolymer transport protein TolR
LVLRVGGDRTIQVNAVAVTIGELPARLKRMFAARDDHILFFDAADDAEYGFAVEVMDQARAGGAVTIAALMTALESQPADAAPAPVAN